MSQEGQSKKSAKKYPVIDIGSLVTVALIAELSWLFVTKANFTIGHTRYRFLIQSVSNMLSSSNFNPKYVIINIGWNDPAGEITRGRTYGLRIGSRVFELDTYYAPKGFQGSLANF